MAKIRLLIVALFVVFVMPLFALAQSQPTLCLPTLAPDSLTPMPPHGTAIKYGDIVSGYLTNCSKFVYSFRGKADETVTIIADGLPGNNTASCLSLTDANGIIVASSKPEYWSNSLRATIRYVTLQNDSLYSIVIDFCNTTNIEFTLHLDLTPAIAVKYGQFIKGEPINPGNASGYEFDGNIGDEVIFQSGPTGLNTLVEVFCVPRFICAQPGQYYNLLASYNISQGSNLTPIRLPFTGKYMLVIQTPSVPSEFSLVISRIAPTQIKYGDVIEVQLSEKNSVGQYRFEGEFGESVQVKVDSDGQLDTTLLMLNGRNELINFTNNISIDDDSGDGFDPEFDGIILPADGIYTVLVPPYQLGDSGVVKLSVTSVSNPSLDKQSQVIALSNKHSTQVIEFTGQSERNVRLTLNRIANTTTLPNLTVYQDSKVLATSASSNAEVSSIEFVVPDNGRVVVMVNGSPGTFELSLEWLG